jgi:hypothetical protein
MLARVKVDVDNRPFAQEVGNCSALRHHKALSHCANSVRWLNLDLDGGAPFGSSTQELT